MTRQRTFALVAAGLLGTAALTACGSEDSRTVGAVAVDGLSPAASTSEAPSAGPSASATPPVQPVSALQTVQGVLERDDDSDDDRDDPADRYDDFTVNGVEVDFGPSEWIIAAPVLQDYDGDGTAEPYAAELDGLVGQQVTLQVGDDDDDSDDRSDDSSDDSGDRLDDADVYEVNGLAVRDLAGPAPWRGGPAPTGALAG
jgi:hypothetical protein